jgi:hypothetical protein
MTETTRQRTWTPEALADLRRERTANHPRRYSALPPAQYLPAEITKLDAEAGRLLARLRTAFDEWTQLVGDEQAAVDADRDAAVAAVLAGKPALSGGAQAQQAHRDRLAALGAEITALPTAISAVEDGMGAEFAKMQRDEKASGRAALATAQTRYAKAIDALQIARAEYHGAKGFAEYLVAAAPPRSWRGVDGRPDHGPRWRNPVSPPLDLSAHAPRLDGRSGNPPQLDVSDVVALLRGEVEAGS